MKTKILFYCLFLSFGFFATTSCSSDNDSGTNPPPAGGSRDVKYEVTGNATGSFNTTYFTESGAGTFEMFSSLPWSKEMTMQPSVSAIGFNVTVSGATPGQTITAKIYVGGVVKREGTATVATNGGTYVSLPSYVF